MKRLQIKDIEELSLSHILDSNNDNLFTFIGAYIEETLERNGITLEEGNPFLGLFSDEDNDQVAIDNSVEYFIEHSNEKYISPIFDKLLKEKEEHEYTFEWVLEFLCRLISSHYAVKWYKIYDALMTEYKPLENYNMEEVRTPDIERSRSGEVHGTSSETGTSGQNLHEEQNTNLSTRTVIDEESKDATNTDLTKSMTIDEESKDATNTDLTKTVGVDTETGVYGFNSANSNPSATGESDTSDRTIGSKADNYVERTHDADNSETVTGDKADNYVERTHDAENSEVITGDKADNYVERTHDADNSETVSGDKDDNFKDSSMTGTTTRSGSDSKAETSTETETGTETLTRHGNIGVTTSQQMLESEIKLRQYNFIEEMYKDIDSILCLKIY